jgi:hypothetical protein
LVNGALRGDDSARVSTPDELLPRLGEITDGWTRRIREAGYDVVGDLDELRPLPASTPSPGRRRVPVADSRDLAVRAVAVLTKEVATLRHELRETEALRQRVADLEAGQGRLTAALRRRLARRREER